jgi:hypothetical protein
MDCDGTEKWMLKKLPRLGGEESEESLLLNEVPL